MSWFARTIANSLKLDDDDDDGKREANSSRQNNPDDEDPSSPSRGVKEDISELTKTLTRNFWGVASFLAPPPQSERRSGSENAESDKESPLGIRADLAEIGGKFRSGISQLSNNINVSEITKLASNFLQLGSDDENEEGRKSGGFEGAVGVTDEVVAFVRDVTMHPETWLDFPLPDVEDDDFGLSDAQQEHALAVERLVPRLAALRIELCPEHMSESCFWMVYFVLLHPRLEEQDAELLSTPQIVDARASLAHELKNRSSVKQEDPVKESFHAETIESHHEEPLSVPLQAVPRNESSKASDLETSTSMAKTPTETVNHPVESSKIQIQETTTSPVKSDPVSASITQVDEDDDADDWLKEEDSSEMGVISGESVPVENEEDVSFSDLEEDDDVDVPVNYRKSNSSSDKDSRDWVQIE